MDTFGGLIEQFLGNQAVEGHSLDLLSLLGIGGCRHLGLTKQYLGGHVEFRATDSYAIDSSDNRSTGRGRCGSRIRRASWLGRWLVGGILGGDDRRNTQGDTQGDNGKGQPSSQTHVVSLVRKWKRRWNRKGGEYQGGSIPNNPLPQSCIRLTQFARSWTCSYPL